MKQVPKYDVVMLGGGPAGCATALALAAHGVSNTLVVESSRYEAARIGESIPPDTRVLLEQLGVWHDFLNEKHEPCLGSCSSWGANALGYNDFLCNPLGNGWHLDRRRFDLFLAVRTAECGAEIRTGTRFVAVERTGSKEFSLKLATDGGQTETVSARFVVDATGRHASFARRMGARKLFLDRLTCIAAFFQLPAWSKFSRLTLLEAVSDGWWYAAKLPDARLAVAFACDPEFMRSAGLNNKANWLAHLNRTMHLSRELAGCAFAEESLMVCTAPSFLLDRATGDGWLAVGDAASAYDPISSQGIYKALSSGLQAAEVVAALLKGATGQLGDYESSVAGSFGNYLENRNYFYGAERRWADAAFWKRRVQRTALEIPFATVDCELH
jgi:flavin-dependent dehydrogenase